MRFGISFALMWYIDDTELKELKEKLKGLPPDHKLEKLIEKYAKKFYGTLPIVVLPIVVFIFTLVFFGLSSPYVCLSFLFCVCIIALWYIPMATRSREIRDAIKIKEAEEEVRERKREKGIKEWRKKEEERRKKLLSNRQYLYSLSNREFEHVVAEILEANGYRVELTKAVADLGADIITYKDSRKCVVEVKQYSEGTKVGTPELQKLQGAMLHYKADAMIFVTLSFFTSQAQSYARQNGIELIDGNELLSMAENIDFGDSKKEKVS